MKKTIVLGVSGGIAVYKACELTSLFVKKGYRVKVVMTKNAAEFVAPLTFETLSNNEVALDMFAPKKSYDIGHISLSKEADVFLVAPATANVIAKLANGVADDMLSTAFLASKAPKIVCPAMNTVMYKDAATKSNIEILKKRGVTFIDAQIGRLACGDVGEGRLASVEAIFEAVDKLLTPNPDLRGKMVLVTAGATVEDIDGVRFISNYSSGKMGVAIAEAVTERGGEVIFVCAKMQVEKPKGCKKVIDVTSTKEMYDAVLRCLPDADIVIKAAAPADYKVKNRAKEKIKDKTLTLELEKNPDIAKAVGERKGAKILVAFAAETTDLLQNAAKKLAEKNADLVVANNVKEEGAGFNADTNIATLLYSDGRVEALPKMPKTDLAHRILDAVLGK